MAGRWAREAPSADFVIGINFGKSRSTRPQTPYSIHAIAERNRHSPRGLRSPSGAAPPSASVNVIELAGVAEHLHGGSVRRRRRIFEATWSKGAQLHGKQNDGRPIDRFNRNRNSTGIDSSGYSEVSSSSGSSHRPSQPCFWQAGRRPLFCKQT